MNYVMYQQEIWVYLFTSFDIVLGEEWAGVRHVIWIGLYPLRSSLEAMESSQEAQLNPLYDHIHVL